MKRIIRVAGFADRGKTALHINGYAGSIIERYRTSMNAQLIETSNYFTPGGDKRAEEEFNRLFAKALFDIIML